MGPIGEAGEGGITPIVGLGIVAPIGLVEAALDFNILTRVQDAHSGIEEIPDIVGLAPLSRGLDGGGQERRDGGSRRLAAGPIYDHLLGRGAFLGVPVADFNLGQVHRRRAVVEEPELGPGVVGGVGRGSGLELQAEGRRSNSGRRRNGWR